MATPLESAKTLYRNTYNSIAGVDIKAVFFGVTFGNLQAISYSITREKAPVYTMGSPEVRGYARGKRAIAGNLVFVMFDEHVLLGALDVIRTKHSMTSWDGDRHAYEYDFVSDIDEIRPMTDDQWSGKDLRHDQYKQLNKKTYESVKTGQNNLDLSPSAFNIENTVGTTIEENWTTSTPWYSDQIPAFNIVLTGVNEDGYAATMSILGVEILNEGYGISIDDLISEQQMTYVARAIARWRSVLNSLSRGVSHTPIHIPFDPGVV